MNTTTANNYIASLQRKLEKLEAGYWARRINGLDYSSYQDSIADVKVEMAWAKKQASK